MKGNFISLKTSIKVSLLSIAVLGMAALTNPTHADELQDAATEVTVAKEQVKQLQTEQLNLNSQIEHIQSKVKKSSTAEQSLSVKPVVPITVNTLVDVQKNKLDSLKVESKNLESRLSAAKEKLEKAETKHADLEKKQKEQEEAARKAAEEAARQEALAAEAKAKENAIASGQVVTGHSQPGFDYANAGTYPVGECTWGVKVMVPFVGPYWGNANQWANSARQAGYRVGTKPIPGAIAVWNGGEYGHVAYVSDVQSETSIQVLESNWGGNRTIGNHRGWFNPVGAYGDVVYIYPN